MSWHFYSNNCTKRWLADVNVHRAECELPQVDHSASLTNIDINTKTDTNRDTNTNMDTQVQAQMQIQQQNVHRGRNVSCHTGGSQCVCDFLLPLLPLHLKETEVHITQDKDVHSLSQVSIQVVTDGL